MSKKIAPTLRRRIRLDYAGPYLFDGDAEEFQRVQREWKAILGVLRVVEKQGPLVSTDWDMKLGKAWARLDRASKGGRK
jgi:hypothetical protein